MEGVLRSKELASYLKSLNAVKAIWLAEDATRITSTISYDSKTNQMIGVVLPLNDNGCPIPFTFIAKDVETMQNCVKLPQAKSVYVVMAQALDETIPPFILQMFGTNNQFNAQDVTRRWEYTKIDLQS